MSFSVQHNVQHAPGARATAGRKSFRRSGIGLLLALCAAQASAAYSPVFCQQIAGTLNIHWRAIGGASAPCTGIELTDGTLADAADGSVNLTGIGVTNNTCIGTSVYAFTMSNNTLQLVGADTASNVPMTLTRGQGDACFVGTWTSGSDVYEAHIWAGAFPLAVPAVPGPGAALLALMAAMLAGVGGWFARSRS